MRSIKLQNDLPASNFSRAAGQLYCDHRSNLLGENAEKLLFLSYNICLFNYDYWTLTASGVATGGSGDSMNRGPGAPGGPRARPQKN